MLAEQIPLGKRPNQIEPLTETLGITVEDEQLRGNLVERIIKDVLVKFDSEPNVRSASELLGFSKRTSEEIAEIAARDNIGLKDSERA